MSRLTGLLPALAGEPGVARLLESVAMPELEIIMDAGARPAVLAAAAQALGAPLLVVTATGRQSEDLAAGLRAYLPETSVVEFPAWETLPHERLSPRADTVGRRLAVLRRLAHPDAAGAAGPVAVIVASVRAVLQPVVRGLGDLEPVVLRPGEDHPLDDVVQALARVGYSRVDMVERRGEFAVRGGILDVFSPTDAHPLRVEFWGDTVEEARWFAVADQRSLEAAPQGLWAPPCREVLLTPEVRRRAEAAADQLPGLADVLYKVAEGLAVEGLESLAPLLVDGFDPLVDLLPAGSRTIVVDPERVRARAHDLVETSREFLQAAWHQAAAGRDVPVDLTGSDYATLAEVRERSLAVGRGWWTVGSLDVDDELSVDDVPRLRVGAVDVAGYRGEPERAAAELRSLARSGWRVVVTAQGAGAARRLVEVLRGGEVPAQLVEHLDGEPAPGAVLVTTAGLERGFLCEAVQLAVVTETDLSGRSSGTRDMRRMPSRRRNVVDPLQLTQGDLVVHEQHGVGRYLEMTQRTVGGAAREYLVIEYAPSKRGQPGDRLYVPSDALDQVTRYVGGEAPTLSRMGGDDWAKTKTRARKAVREIAGELIRLYSARMASSGHAFGPDTPWQRELEDAFGYVETPDQLACIEEVKADMEKPVPMDRLICGDVGYGKTEIAVRAAFKAVQDGKQVAVLVPTTLLVQQHLDTFAERYAQFPVTVRGLSRFESEKDSAETLAGLASGGIDVVIGTHRLLSGEVRFKDLGLIVVDEEQRFGVEHKEKLKQLRTNVDVLAMSATPIPRTLEMALVGARDLSVIETPPVDRLPIQTVVGPYDEKQIAAAIRRELLREGQVFFVHNRVESIERAASRLAELVPEARIAVAHGKLGEHRLEQVINEFWDKQSDVLVCTTIIETGLDISNANTLILERADALGLSQLHQLRGRVGRGRERAYAYFLFPPEKPLTETAHDRLETIAAHTDLGAGTRIAMKDLEIRGAGNLLGGEQSGHIAGVGFDLYVRLVGEAVAAFRGEPDQAQEVKIELPVTAHLPHEYVPGERLRLEAYRKIAEATSPEEVEAVRAELQDRYGTPPEPVLNLLEVARFRILARTVGLTEVTAQGQHIRFTPVNLPESGQMRLQRLYPRTLLKEAVRSILVPRPTVARIGGEPLRDTALLTWARGLIEDVLQSSSTAAARSGAR